MPSSYLAAVIRCNGEGKGCFIKKLAPCKIFAAVVDFGRSGEVVEGSVSVVVVEKFDTALSSQKKGYRRSSL